MYDIHKYITHLRLVHDYKKNCHFLSYVLNNIMFVLCQVKQKFYKLENFTNNRVIALSEFTEISNISK